MFGVLYYKYYYVDTLIALFYFVFRSCNRFFILFISYTFEGSTE